MPLLIPIFREEPLYNERVRLEGKDYLFRFDWADREQRFYMSIFNPDGDPLLVGIKLVANWALLFHHRFNPDLPPGELFAFDLETGGEPPLLSDFGSRVRLFYYESTENLIDLSGDTEFVLP